MVAKVGPPATTRSAGREPGTARLGATTGVCRVPGRAREKRSAPKPAARWPGSKRGRRQVVKPTWQYCDDPDCRYYGWPGLGNLRANGYPNGGRWRQWHCQACRQFFIETRGTPLYRRSVAPNLVHQVLTGLAEGLSLEATARLFELEPETVAQWLALAANHFEALSAYLSQNLELEQVQLDDLYVKLRLVQSSDRTSVRWLYNAIDPVSKFWLTFRLGARGLGTVQSLVQQLVQQLAPGVIPLFLSDGERSFETSLLSHYGQWGQVADLSRAISSALAGASRVCLRPGFKRRLRRRLVSVKHRLVRGQLKPIKAKLAEHGCSINTAFIERFNLTLRQHVPALRRRVLALARSEAGLQHQLTLVQLYYNLSLPPSRIASSRAGGASSTSGTDPSHGSGFDRSTLALGRVVDPRPPMATGQPGLFQPASELTIEPKRPRNQTPARVIWTKAVIFGRKWPLFVAAAPI